MSDGCGESFLTREFRLSAEFANKVKKEGRYDNHRPAVYLR
jgi:hypothetical protein